MSYMEESVGSIGWRGRGFEADLVLYVLNEKMKNEENCREQKKSVV